MATVALTVAAGVLLAGVFAGGMQAAPVAYAVYALSAYALAVLVAALVRLARWGVPRVRGYVEGHGVLGPLAASRDLRGRAGMRATSVLNGVYGLFLLVFGVAYESPWLGSLGVYYLVEATARGLLVRADGGVRAVAAQVRLAASGASEASVPQEAAGCAGLAGAAAEVGVPQGTACCNGPAGGRAWADAPGDARAREMRAYRACAWLLVVLDLALSGLAVQMVRDGQWFSYPGYLIYVAAGYTFYSATMAALNFVRSRAADSPVVRAMRDLGVCTALVSVLTLQTAMFASFDTSGGALPQVMNAITAAVVCAGIAAVAIGMLRWSSRHKA